MPTIKNTLFAELLDKAKVTIAGIVRSIEDLETGTGTAKRFKGDFAVQIGDDTYRGKYLYLPAPLRDAVWLAIQKLGKWEGVEFVLVANKSVTNEDSSWSVSFSTPPRIEIPRVLAMLPA